MLEKPCFLLLTAMLGVMPVLGRSLTNDTQQQELQQAFIGGIELTELASITVGLRVVRGSSWTFGNQDGGAGNVGVITSVDETGWLWVTWSSGERNPYPKSSLATAPDLIEKIILTAPATQTYQLMKMKQNWVAARGICQSLGGDLASLPSYKLIKEIHDQVATAVPGESVWLGGLCSPSDANGCENHRHTTGWRWLTGEQIALKENGNGQWLGGEPFSNNQFYYLSFSGYSAAGQPALYSYTGSSEYYFLCEF